MSRTRHAVLPLLLVGFLALSTGVGFTPGNIVVLGGTPSPFPSASACQVVLVEATQSGTVVQRIAFPAVTSPASCTVGGCLTIGGSDTIDGFMTLSTDGRYLVVPGYFAPIGTSNLATSTQSTAPRMVGLVDIQTGAMTLTTIFGNTTGTPFDQSFIRSAVSTDGTKIWASGSQNGAAATAGGIWYTADGGVTATRVAAATSIPGALGIFNGQLYAASKATGVKVATVGTGLPTAAGAAVVNLPNLANLTNTQGFMLFDLSTSEAGVDTLYIGDQVLNNVYKWCSVSGTWQARGMFFQSSGTMLGMSGYLGSDGVTVTLFVVDSANILKLVDATGYNVAITYNNTQSTNIAPVSSTFFNASFGITRSVVYLPIPPSASSSPSPSTSPSSSPSGSTSPSRSTSPSTSPSRSFSPTPSSSGPPPSSSPSKSQIAPTPSRSNSPASTPSPQPNSVFSSLVGYVDGLDPSVQIAQSFYVTKTCQTNVMGIKAYWDGNGAPYRAVVILTLTKSTPSEQVLLSGNVTPTSGTNDLIMTSGPTPITLVAGNTYWLTAKRMPAAVGVGKWAYTTSPTVTTKCGGGLGYAMTYTSTSGQGQTAPTGQSFMIVLL